jgi:hypothetical protein
VDPGFPLYSSFLGLWVKYWRQGGPWIFLYIYPFSCCGWSIEDGREDPGFSSISIPSRVVSEELRTAGRTLDFPLYLSLLVLKMKYGSTEG